VLATAGFLVVVVLLIVIGMAWLPVQLIVKADREAYTVGGSAHVDILLSYGPNFLRGPVVIPVVDYDVLISGSSMPVLGMRGFVYTEQPVKLSPNTTQKIGQFDWDLKDASGNAVAPGTYTITVRLLDYPVSGETTIRIY
jgi:hypothetical protein